MFARIRGKNAGFMLLPRESKNHASAANSVGGPEIEMPTIAL